MSVIGLAAVTVATFAPAFTAGFTNWDDLRFIVDNKMIRGLSLENVKGMFGRDYEPLLIPVVWLSYAVEIAVFSPEAGSGPDGLNPTAMHTVNILLHLLNAFLVLLLIRRLTNNFFASFLAAVFFAVHPMHVESVAWLSERKDVLSTLFMLAALLSYCSYISKGRFIFYIISFIAFALGVLSKPMVVTLPLLLILFDWFLGERVLSRKRLLEKIPFFVGALFIGVVTVVWQRRGGGVAEGWMTGMGANFMIAASNIVFYLGKLVAPVKLSAVYPPPVREAAFSSGNFISLAIFVIVLAAAVVTLKWTKKIFFGFLFFLVTVLPVIQLIPVGVQNTADKFTYVPYIGLFMIAGLGADYAVRRAKAPPVRLVIGILLAALVCGASVLSFWRCRVWTSGVTLWEDAHRHYPAHPFIANSLAHAYIVEAEKSGTAEERTEWLRKAELLAREATEIDPEHTNAYQNLGIIWRMRGDFDKARRFFEKCLEIDSDYILAYGALGGLLQKSGDPAGAIRYYKKRIELQPSEAIYVNLGAAYMDAGNYRKAIENYEKALEMDPGSGAAHFNLGNAYLKLGGYEKALSELKRAIAIDPKLAGAYLNAGVALLNKKEPDEALVYFKKALELGGDALSAHWNIAHAYVLKGDGEKALAELQKALALEPSARIRKEIEKEIEKLREKVKKKESER